MRRNFIESRDEVYKTGVLFNRSYCMFLFFRIFEHVYQNCFSFVYRILRMRYIRREYFLIGHIVCFYFSEYLSMFIKTVLVLFIVFYEKTDAQRCRQCVGATSLLSCTQSLQCGDDEECYMDKYVTNQHASVYYAGCRASTTCQAGAVPHLPAGVQSVSCSKCCDANSTSGIECNVNLCGIQTTVSKATQCYFCDSSRDGSMDEVSDPTSCTGVTTCQADEVCGVDDIALSGHTMHRYTCKNARLCAFLTKRALEDMKRCKDPAAIASGLCGSSVGKRSAGMTICTACCGDSMCNYGTCLEVLDNLYDMWTNGTLDVNTLKTISSAATGTIVG